MTSVPVHASWTCAVLVGAAASTACTDSGGQPEPACVPGLTPVRVVSTELRDQFVRLDLEYAGGCEQHEFAVWWSGVAAPSLPPQVPFELQHYDHGDSCEALLSTSIWVDLSPVHAMGDHVLIDFVMGSGTTDNWLTRVDYTKPAVLGPAPASTILVDETCGVIGH